MTYPAHPWRCLLATLILICVSVSARAANCSYTAETPARLVSVSNLTGSITVGRDVAVGNVIYRASFYNNIATNVYISCPVGTFTAGYRYIMQSGEPSGYTHPQYGTVYNTSVPGIGYAVWRNNAPMPQLSTYGGGGKFLMPTGFDVSFIKTSPVVAPGVINGAELMNIEAMVQGDSVVQGFVSRFVGSLTVVANTCRTPDVRVDLGEHSTSDLQGKGTTTKMVDVNIQLFDCPAFYGAARRTITEDGVISDNAPDFRANNILYSVRPTSSIIDVINGIMAIQNAGGAGSAQGVGIQILNATTLQPYVLTTTQFSGLTLTESSGPNYVIPLKARYIQTGPTVTAGQADGQATVTLIYR